MFGVFFASFVGCSGKYKEDEIVYNNDFFTKELYQEIIEIYIIIGSKDYHITDRDVIFNIYKEFASLVLDEEYNPPFPPEALLGGGIASIYLVASDDSTIQVDFPREDTIRIPYQSSGKEYVIDKKVEPRLVDLMADWLENNLSSEEFKELGIKRE